MIPVPPSPPAPDPNAALRAHLTTARAEIDAALALIGG
jgi:hypothetical protein